MTTQSSGVGNRRLDSWKEIAAYLARDVRTVIRWEKERGLPIHRVPGGKKNAVFAFTSSLDSWLMADTQPASSRALAVLPFGNSTGDPNLEYLCEGITESLINRLAQSPELRVLARSTVFRYRGPDIDAREAGRSLGVPVVVAGIVRQERDEVIVSAELVNTRTGSQLWGSRYVQPLTQIWSLELRIVDAIAGQLSLHLSPNEHARLTRASTQNPEAMRAYWQARHAQQKMSEQGLQEAIVWLQKAVELDSGYARAYGALAEIYGLMAIGYSNERPIPDLIKLGEQAARTALSLDPQLAEAHTALGILLAPCYDLGKVEVEFRRALELEPSNALAHNLYGYLLMCRGRYDEAVAEADLAVEVDPGSMFFMVDAASIHAYSGDLEVGRELIERARKSFTTTELAYPGWMYVLGLIEQLAGNYQKAIEVLEQSTQHSILHTIPLGILGYCYAKLDRRDKAEEVLDRLAILPPHRHTIHFSRAIIFAALGENDRALDSLEKGYEEKNPWLFFLKPAPWFDEIRQHPRYGALIERLSL